MVPGSRADGGLLRMLFDCQRHAEDTGGEEACTEVRGKKRAAIAFSIS